MHAHARNALNGSTSARDIFHLSRQNYFSFAHKISGWGLGFQCSLARTPLLVIIMAKNEVLGRLLGILEEAKDSTIPDDRLKKCLKSMISTVDPLTKGYRILNCLLFQIYPVLFLFSLLGYPLFKLLDGSPCLITEVTPFGEAMIPVMNCR